MDIAASLDAIALWLDQAMAALGQSMAGWLPSPDRIAGVFAGWRAHPDVAISSSLAALAACLALASIGQTRTVRKRLESVKSDFFAAFRPKFIVRDVYAPHCSSGEPIEVRYSVCNVGASPAKIVESAIAVEVLRPTGLALVPHCDGRNPVGEIELNAGEAHCFGYRSPEVSWDPGLVKSGAASKLRLVFAGQLGYIDSRGVTRRTSFCRAFDVKRERFYPMDDPELEYAD